MCYFYFQPCIQYCTISAGLQHTGNRQGCEIHQSISKAPFSSITLYSHVIAVEKAVHIVLAIARISGMTQG